MGGDWGDTSVVLPEGRWRNELTGETTGGGAVPVSRLSARFPVVLLSLEEGRNGLPPLGASGR